MAVDAVEVTDLAAWKKVDAEGEAQAAGKNRAVDNTCLIGDPLFHPPFP